MENGPRVVVAVVLLSEIVSEVAVLLTFWLKLGLEFKFKPPLEACVVVDVLVVVVVVLVVVDLLVVVD